MKHRLLYTLALMFATLQTFAQTYTYDDNNRLTKVVYGNGVTVTYDYDALGNRTSKKVTGGSTVDSNIEFADTEVKRLCVENWDTNGDGELSYDEAAAVTFLDRVFVGNEKITSFNELQYFTGLKWIGVPYENHINSFAHCSKLASVTIPNSVTGIGNAAFYYSGLTSITIPNSVSSIGREAFSCCVNLTSVAIPNSVTTIEEYAFIGGKSLTNIDVEKENTAYASVDGVLFDKNITTIICYPMGKQEKSYTIPNSVRSIGSGTFAECWNLSSVTIPNSVTIIGSNAFHGCVGLHSIDIPNSVTSIEDFAFGSCVHLTSFTIPNSVTRIGKWTFDDCPNLVSVTIPNSVTSIGEGAFKGCNSLKEVKSFITEPFGINPNVFTNYNFTSATYNFTNATLYVPYGTKSFYETTDGWKEFTNIVEMEDNPTGNIQFADAEVKRLCVENWDTNGDGELSYDEAAAVKDLEQVFSGNPKIVSFDEFKYFTGVETINRFEFKYCDNLSSIKFPNSIKIILPEAFSCTSLTSISIPKSVIDIGPAVFVACEKLTSITVEEGNTVYDSRDNCNAIIYKRSNLLIVGCKNTVIPATVSAISDYAFDGCTGLTSIEIPSGVRHIGPAAFAGCGLTSITIPKSVSYIGEIAFKSCQNLSSITVEEGNTVYDSRDNCNAIINTKTNVLISGCKSTVIPNTVTAIGRRAFEGHSTLTEIAIPNSVTSIGEQAFYSTGIESLHIPSSVTTIGSKAFGGCNKLKTITFEKWPENVGSQIVFYGFNSLEKVIVLDRQPTTIGNDTFLNHYDGTWTAATLYVPAGTKALYEATDGWKNFKNIVEMEPEIVAGDITGTGVVENEDVDAFIELYLDDEIPEEGDADFSRFDANGDGIITLADAVAIFYLSNGLNFDGTDPNAARAALPMDNGEFLLWQASQRAERIMDNYYVVTVEATELGNGIVRYTLTSDFEYAGFAVDVKGARVVGESAEGMTLRSAETKGRHRIVAYNFGQAAAAGTVLTLDVLGEAQFSNINFSDANARNIRFSLGETTGIVAKPIDNGKWIMDYFYDLNGREWKSMKKGVNILRTVNGKAKKVSVK